MLYGSTVEEPLPPYARTVGETEDAREEADVYFARIVGQARKVAASMDVPITCEVQRGNPVKVLIERRSSRRSRPLRRSHRSMSGLERWPAGPIPRADVTRSMRSPLSYRRGSLEVPLRFVHRGADMLPRRPISRR